MIIESRTFTANTADANLFVKVLKRNQIYYQIKRVFAETYEITYVAEKRVELVH